MPKTKMTIVYDKEIGRRVKEAREKAGMTKHQLAVALHYSDSMISQIEQGNRGLQQATAIFLSSVSGLRLDYILNHDDYRTNEEMLTDMLAKADFFKTWSSSFVKMIAEQLEYNVSKENGHYTFTENHYPERCIAVPEKEVSRFAGEIYDYGLFKLERVIDSYKLKPNTQEKEEEKK